MPLTQLSARFFFELALGLWAALACIDRRTIGPGFTRLMAGFVLGSLIPAWLLGRVNSEAAAPLANWLGVGFGVGVLATLLIAGRFSFRAETLFVLAVAAIGAGSMLATVHAGVREVWLTPLLLVSSLGSMLVLGLVTGAMILGHWYLVTPDLPVAHLGRLTRLALVASYVKLALLAATIFLVPHRFGVAAHAFGGVVGLGHGTSGASFQSQLDFLWLIARVAIGLIGPAALCHMTLATVRLKATQPATGILYAATVMVLMGELFAFVGEASFGVVL